MLYVKKVSSNIKRGCDIELAPKTIIVGATGSGKSSVTDAVELALTGQVDNVAGKSASQAIELMKLRSVSATEDEDLFARVTLSDNGECSYSASGSTAKASRPKHVLSLSAALARMPLRDIRTAFVSSQDALRDLFLMVVSKAVSDADVEAILSAESFEAFAALGPGPAFHKLSAVQEKANKEKRDANAAIKRLADEHEVSAGVPPLQSAVTDAERAENEAGEKHTAAIRAFGAIEAEAKANTAAQTPTYATPADLATNKAPIWRAGRELLTVLGVLATDSRAEQPCPICKSGVKTHFIKSRIIDVRAKMDAQARARTVNAPVVVQEYSAADKKRLHDAEALCNTTRAAYDAARNKLQALREARVAYENNSRVRKLAEKAKLDADKWKRIELDCRSASDKLLAREVDAVMARVQKYLPPEYRFGVVLQSGERRVCHVGFAEFVSNEADAAGDIHIRSAISDGERSMLLTALSVALGVDDNSSDKTLNVIIPPDCSMDSNTLSKMLLALVDAPCQVLLTSTTQPSVVPAGWNMITLRHDTSEAAL